MKKIKTIIIDDEENAAHYLSHLLNKHCKQTIDFAGSFYTIDRGLQAIKTLQPDLIFLDVHIQNKTAFDLLKQIPQKTFNIIFATAYDKYAIEAFKCSATDYLLKPILPDDLVQAISKIVSKNPAIDVTEKLQTLLENIDQLKQFTPPKKIIIPTVNGFELIPVIDIIRCESEINYTSIYIKDRHKLVVAKTLKEFEEILSEYNFYRIHNSHLINLAYIKSYQKGKGGSVIMIDNTELEVSTRRKEDFLTRMAKI